MRAKPSYLAENPSAEPALEVRLLWEASEILALTEPWLALDQNAPLPSFFQSHAWCRYVLDHIAQFNKSSEVRPVIATAWADERLIAIWPLAIRRDKGIRVLTSLGSPFDQYSEILMASHIDVAAVIAALVQALRATKIADGLILRKVRLTASAYGMVALGAHIVDEGSRAPQVTLDVDAPFGDFLKTISSKTRKNLRNYTNRLNRIGRVEHRVLRGADIAPAIALTYDGRRAWLETKGLSSTAFRDDNFEKFVTGLTGPEAIELGLIVFALMLDERMIALQWGFIHQGRYYAYLSTRDPEFEAYSTGRIHLQHVLEACHERGIGMADLMVPAVPYKMNWTDVADPVIDLVWPWTTRGYLQLKVYEQGLRPLLKRVVLNLPLGVRQGLFAVLSGAKRAH